MDPVAFAPQSDPGQSNRIVRARLDCERLFGVHALEVIFRIVVIGRVFLDLCDLELAGGRGLLFTSDRRRIEGDQLILRIERFHCLCGLVDRDPSDFPGERVVGDGGRELSNVAPGLRAASKSSLR